MIAKVWLTFTLSAGVLCTSTAWAHHPRPTARPTGSGLALTTDLGGEQGARIDARVGTEFAYFDRLLEREAARDGGGSLLIGTLVPSFSGRFETGTTLQARLPVGFVVSDGPTQSSETSFGLGDLSVAATQELSGLWSDGPGPVSVGLRVQLMAPTGRYRSDATMSFTDVSPSDGGGLDVVTYDTQSSLGAGAWSGSVGLQMAAWLAPRVQINAASQVTVPLSKTLDDIRWGRDLDLQMGLTLVPWSEVLAVVAGVDYRWHDLDVVPDETTGDVTRVGGRHEFGVAAGLQGRLGRSLTCGGRVHWPLWQRAGGVQLVETVSAQLSCGYAFAL